ncbi:LOW QUALITY PROTEIN: Cytochrome P [Trema orientale]|uniref:Cytochrome P n=1 Tax=Trema orientale TaxID=63057 RepID=A0A2P5FRJ6_TREOI|nr:LOW QUALITY PROTEIN: Cytochrome P [Trema orientale]
MILGDRSLLDLNGDDHKRVRSTLVSFSKPESLKHFVGILEEEFRSPLQMHWQGKQQVKVRLFFFFTYIFFSTFSCVSNYERKMLTFKASVYESMLKCIVVHAMVIYESVFNIILAKAKKQELLSLMDMTLHLYFLLLWSGFYLMSLPFTKLFFEVNKTLFSCEI